MPFTLPACVGWLGGRGSNTCLWAAETVWKSFCRECEVITSRRLPGGSKGPALVGGHPAKWQPSGCRAAWLPPAAVSTGRTGVMEARLESLRGSEAQEGGWWQERGDIRGNHQVCLGGK